MMIRELSVSLKVPRTLCLIQLYRNFLLLLLLLIISKLHYSSTSASAALRHTKIMVEGRKLICATTCRIIWWEVKVLDLIHYLKVLRSSGKEFTRRRKKKNQNSWHVVSKLFFRQFIRSVWRFVIRIISNQIFSWLGTASELVNDVRLATWTPYQFPFDLLDFKILRWC